MQDLIIVKQLPQIEEHLKELSIDVDKKVEYAKSLICTDENIKTIKLLKKHFKKQKAILQNKRIYLWIRKE